MKKFALILAMSSVVALTACQKEVTEVKKGSTVEVKNVSLTSNNAADVQADMEKIQTLAMQQESKAGDLNQRLEQALQSQNEDEVKKLFPSFKAAMLDNLAALQQLKLQSTEVTELRQKLNDMTKVGLELQEKLIQPNVKPEDLQGLQGQGAQLQQEIMMLTQHIQQIVTGNQPVAPADTIAPHEALAQQPEIQMPTEDAAPETAQ